MRYLLIIFLTLLTMQSEGKKYSLTFMDGSSISFEQLSLIEFEKYKEDCTIIPNEKKDTFNKVYKNTSGNIIGQYGELFMLKFKDEKDYKKILSKDVVLFRNEEGSKLYPFYYIKESEVKEIINSSKIEPLELHNGEQIFNECNFYKLSDGRVLAEDKADNSGEVYMNIEGLLAYYSFIEGFDFKVVIGINK